MKRNLNEYNMKGRDPRQWIILICKTYFAVHFFKNLEVLQVLQNWKKRFASTARKLLIMLVV
jgi:hypothetical protein